MFVSLSQKIKMTNSQPNLGKFHDLHVKTAKKMLSKTVKSQKQSWTKTQPDLRWYGFILIFRVFCVLDGEIQ